MSFASRAGVLIGFSSAQDCPLTDTVVMSLAFPFILALTNSTADNFFVCYWHFMRADNRLENLLLTVFQINFLLFLICCARTSCFHL